MPDTIENFEALIAKGELGRRDEYADDYGIPSYPGAPRQDPARFGPPADGFQAQTANGTARATGTGWNKDDYYCAPQVRPDPTRPAGRSNRTGE